MIYWEVTVSETLIVWVDGFASAAVIVTSPEYVPADKPWVEAPIHKFCTPVPDGDERTIHGWFATAVHDSVPPRSLTLTPSDGGVALQRHLIETLEGTIEKVWVVVGTMDEEPTVSTLVVKAGPPAPTYPWLAP